MHEMRDPDHLKKKNVRLSVHTFFESIFMTKKNTKLFYFSVSITHIRNILILLEYIYFTFGWGGR